MSNLKVIGITGGIGTGKSEVLKIASSIEGAIIVEADKVAKDLMKLGGACFERIVALFGESVLAADGSLDSNALGSIVLSDEKKLARLNSVVHPEVKDYIKNDK